MDQDTRRRGPTGPLVLGILLIVFGGAALLARAAGLDVWDWIGEAGWPFFVIIPGVVLLVASLIPPPPRGVGLAVPGAIVTTVGLILLYQSRSGDWESWAWIWAALPLAAGLALVAYGTYARTPNLVTSGLWTSGIAALALLVGAWFFGNLFSTNRLPLEGDLIAAIIVIVIGVAIVGRAVLFPRRAGPGGTEGSGLPPAA